MTLFEKPQQGLQDCPKDAGSLPSPHWPSRALTWISAAKLNYDLIRIDLS
jgi:hypothetical protein